MQLDFPKQFRLGIDAAKSVKVSGDFKRVIFCGIGGSAMPADIISMLWLEGINMYVHKGYGLPFFAKPDCLVICTSWSGNTEEIISSYQAAQARAIPTVVISRGGRLLTMAKTVNQPYVELPSDSDASRLSIGYMLAALLTVLHNSAIIDYSLEGFDYARSAESPTFASRIGNKIPLIYSSYPWRYLARMWKINFNENCKQHAFFSYFPEAAHNEIAGFQSTQKDTYFPIVLMDRAEEPTDVTKLNKFVGFLQNQQFDYALVELVGQNRLEKIITSYDQAVAISTDLAQTLGIDPLDISIIEQFKQR